LVFTSTLRRSTPSPPNSAMRPSASTHPKTNPGECTNSRFPIRTRP
jgi:hypothetical protein